MKTSQKPISQSGEDESTSSLEDFRVSPSVMPGSDAATRITVTSGLRCSAALAKSDPVGSWLKTLLVSSRWWSKARYLRWQTRQLFSHRLTTFTDTSSERPLPLNASAQTLKVTDMPSSRCLYQLAVSVPPTGETACSSSEGAQKPFLKTPCTADSYTDQVKSRGVRGASGTLAQEIVNGYAGKHRGLLLPPPLVVEREHPERVQRLKEAGATQINSRACGEQRPNGIIDFIQFYDMLPTPTAIEGVKWTNTWNPNSQMGQLLSAMAGSGMLPTPVARDWKGETKRGGDTLPDTVMRVAKKATAAAPAGATSRLSPLFTEEMMGFPFLWTALPFLFLNGAQRPSKPTATP